MVAVVSANAIFYMRDKGEHSYTSSRDVYLESAEAMKTAKTYEPTKDYFFREVYMITYKRKLFRPAEKSEKLINRKFMCQPNT